MKPVCVKCQRFFKPKKCGIYITEGMPVAGYPEPGIEEAKHWQPYKIWHADLYECAGCGTEIITGFARQPLAEHYQEGFGITQLLSQFTVNDC